MNRNRLLQLNHFTMINKINRHASLLAAGSKTLLLCLLTLSILSCNKDKQIDMDILSSKNTATISYIEGGNLVLLNGKIYNFTNSKIGVAIPLQEKSKSADTITAIVDPSLVAVYNQEHLETNPVIPDGAFTVSHLGVFPVSGGALSATDSLYVQLTNGSTLKHNTVYLVPVRLSSKNGAKLKYTTFYFKVKVSIGTLKAYMNGGSIFNGTVGNRITGGSYNFVYINGFPDSLKFSVATNSIFPAHEVQVEASVMTPAQTDSVNIGQRYGAVGFPADTYTMTKSVVKVATNSKIGTDSITVKFRNRANFTTFKYYLLALKLKRYAGSDYGVTPVPNDSSNVYIRFFLF